MIAHNMIELNTDVLKCIAKIIALLIRSELSLWATRINFIVTNSVLNLAFKILRRVCEVAYILLSKLCGQVLLCSIDLVDNMEM